MMGDWNEMSFKVRSNPNVSMILQSQLFCFNTLLHEITERKLAASQAAFYYWTSQFIQHIKTVRTVESPESNNEMIVKQ